MEKNFRDWLEEQMLCEMSKVFTNDEKGFKTVCYVNPDQHRKGNEYFKIYDNISLDKSKKVACICFRKPKYFHHNTTVRKEHWYLNNKQKEKLIKVLSEKHDYFGHELTNFQIAIVEYNYEKSLGSDRSKTVEMTLENKVNDLKYPNHLPIDLEMPDYLKLPD